MASSCTPGSATGPSRPASVAAAVESAGAYSGTKGSRIATPAAASRTMAAMTKVTRLAGPTVSRGAITRDGRAIDENVLMRVLEPFERWHNG
jgi:hypothetical protein